MHWCVSERVYPTVRVLFYVRVQVREGLRVLSNWPTYPQLYVNGTLVGGLDIVKELRNEGELADVLRCGLYQ